MRNFVSVFLLPIAFVRFTFAADPVTLNWLDGTAPSDNRPRVVLADVDGASFRRFDVAPVAGADFSLRRVKSFGISESPGVPDTRHESTEKADL